MALRRYMLAALTPRQRIDAPDMRSPVEQDAAALAVLMHKAYLGTTDDEGDTVEAALVEVRKTFAGNYGAFVARSSKLVERDGQLLHATLVTRWQGRPFVAFSMSAPEAKRSGLARAALVSAMQDLRDHGECELRLVVTLASTPARGLCESLGFVVQDD